MQLPQSETLVAALESKTERRGRQAPRGGAGGAGRPSQKSDPGGGGAEQSQASAQAGRSEELAVLAPRGNVRGTSEGRGQGRPAQFLLPPLATQLPH